MLLNNFPIGCTRVGKTLLVCGTRDQTSNLISRTDFLKHVGAQNLLPHIQAALERATQIQGDFEGIGRELARELEHRPL
jgi:sulfate permease, SulP family